MLSHKSKNTPLFGVLVFFLSIFLQNLNAQCGNQLLLNTWSKRGPNGNGNWVVAPDNKSVLQTINGNPTFFVSPDSVINTTVRGSFSVNTTGDDDFIGFVFGFRGPVSTGTDYDFYLFDWKQGNQGAALEGFTLSRVNSANGSSDFWGHTGAGLSVLATKYSTSLGWADNTLYGFELTFTDSTILIKIDGDTIFDVAGSFQNGLFGFYNYSQAQVQYNNFTDNACPVAQNDTAEVIEYGATTVSVLSNDSDADLANVLSVGSIYTTPLNGTAQITNGGKKVLYIPNPGYSGVDSLQYIVLDGVGGQDTAWLFITVLDVNGPHALDLVGNGIFATVPHPADMSFDVPSNQDLTLEMWIKTDGSMTGTQLLLQKGTSPRMEVGMTNGKITAVIDDGTNMDSAASSNRYDDGKWHQVAVVLDRSSGLKVYVDGNADGSDNALAAGALTNTDALIIGGGAGASHFQGLIDEVRIWKAALLLADIQRFRNIRIPKTDPLWTDLSAYYQMDKGSGITIYDYSANNNAGTLNSASWRALSPANLAITGDTFTTEGFSYDYLATKGDTCSRLFGHTWAATNGVVNSVSADSLKANTAWDIGQTTGSIALSAMHSNWGSSEMASLAVTINPPVTFNDSVAICQGDSVLIEGVWQSTSATFADTVALANGLDSIYMVTLNVLPNVAHNQMLSICDGDSALVAGVWQTVGAVYIDTLTSGNGCDSILTTTLLVHPVFNTASVVGIASGDSVLAGGMYQKYAGVYYDSLTSINGCDSLHETTVNISGLDRYFTFTGNPNYTTSVLDPKVGDEYTTFTFEVTYYDTNGILPPFGYPRAILDFEGNGNYNNAKDRTLILTEVDGSDIDPTDGKVYTGSIGGLSIGTTYKAIIQVVESGQQVLFGPFDCPDVLAQPDLEIFANNITFSVPNPPVNSPLTVNATITNASDYVANNFVVHLVNQFDTTIVYPDTIVPSLAPRSSTTVSWNITTPAVDAFCPMEVSVDYTDVITESNELDNVAIRPFINGDFNLPGTIAIYQNVSPKVRCSTPGASVKVSGYAYYSGTAVQLKDSSVAGAEVTIYRGGATYKGLTNSKGFFSMNIPSPVSVGSYGFNMEVTDFTLTGSTIDSFKVKSCPCTLPDLSTSFSVSPGTIGVGGSVSGEITVRNIGCDTTITTGLRISQNGGTPIVTGQTVPPLAPGQTFKYNFAGMTFGAAGTYTLCATADSANIVPESNESNNSACATVRVIVPEPDIHPYSGPTGTRYACGNPLNPNITIRNGGTAAAGSFVCRVISRFNGVPIDTTYKSFAGLAAGAFGSISVPQVPNAIGTYSFALSCDTANSVLESNEANNTATYTVVYLQCKPDLTIANCRNLKVNPLDPPAPGPVTFEATVRNSGNDTAVAPIAVRFTIAGGAVINTTINNDLAPGQSQLVQVNATSVASSATLLTAEVDPLDVIDEFSEANNSQSDNMCWEFNPVRRCGPYGVNFWERSYSVNQTAYLSVGVDVDHLYKASSVDVKFEISGPGIVGTQNLGNATVTNLERTCGCPYAAILPTNVVFNQPGTYTFTMTTDPNNIYPECNEGNNVKVVTVNVFANIPDMRILSQFVQPSKINPDVGEVINLNVTYENIGSQNIGAQMELKVLVDEIPLDSIKPVFGLVNNDNTTYAIPTSWSSNLPGVHVVRAIIDSDNEIVESNELNNEATRAIVVGDASNLFFADFSVNNASPANGDNITINAKVANNGDINTKATVRFSYIDDLQDTIFIGSAPVNVPSGDTTMVMMGWLVLDSSTTLIGEIVNSQEIEFTYNDNIATTQIGAFGLSISAVAGCAGTNNGSLTATVTGGTAPFSYSWSNGFSGPVLSALPGYYSVMVTDGTGFTVSASDTIKTIPGSLTILPNLNICEGDSALIFGNYIDSSGVYYDTIQTVSGCDSVLQQLLFVNQGFLIQMPSMAICEGDSLLIFGVYRKAAGLYYDSLLTTASGCDSVLVKQLTVNPVYNQILTPISICDGDSALIFGSYRYVANVYSQKYIAANGCDSSVTVTLNVNPNTTHTVQDSICAGDSLYIGGAWQTTAGSYIDVFVAGNGCDSTLTTVLTIRTDSGCVADTSTQGCLTVVSDNTWMKSTVVSASNFSGFWPGAASLPNSATFTDPVVVGQPYGYPSINTIDGSDVISTGHSVTYFRKEFSLTKTGDLDVRVLVTVDDQADIYLNGHRVALISSFGRPNYKFPAHDAKFTNASVNNGHLSGDAYDVISVADLDTVLQPGTNELIVAVRNLGKPTDLGGFSFRMDVNCDDNIITKKTSDAVSLHTNGLILYPNPVSERLSVQSELAINMVRLFDLNGKLIFMKEYNAEKLVDLYMGDLPKGVYLIEVNEVGEGTQVQKITKM